MAPNVKLADPGSFSSLGVAVVVDDDHLRIKRADKRYFRTAP